MLLRVERHFTYAHGDFGEIADLDKILSFPAQEGQEGDELSYWMDETKKEIKFLFMDDVRFLSGLLQYVLDKLPKNDQIEVDYTKFGALEVPKNVDPVTNIGEFELRDFQIDAIKRAVKAQRGVISLPTGTGKTALGVGLILTLKKVGICPGLIVVNRSELMKQTYDVYKKQGVDCGMFGDGIRDIDHDVVIAVSNSIYSGLKDFSQDVDDLLDRVKVLIWDECLPSMAQVLLENNITLSIEEIYNRDDITQVMSYNLEKSSYELKKIIRKIKLPRTSTYYRLYVVYKGVEYCLRCTANHKIYTKNKGYIRADEIKEGDLLIYNTSVPVNFWKTSAGNDAKGKLYKFVYNHCLPVTRIKTPHGGPNTGAVYNLEVADNHNYFADNFLVSNCHHIGGYTWSIIALNCQAPYKIGMSATPFVSATNEIEPRDMALIGLTGNVILNITTKSMIDAGYLIPAHIYMPVVRKDTFAWTKIWHTVYSKGIENNNYRNNLIAILVSKLVTRKEKIFVIIKTIKHGEALNKLLKARGVNSVFYHGGKNSEDDVMRLKDAIHHYDVTIATSGISVEGLNIPEITTLVNAQGGKSSWQVKQLIGRGLRPSVGKSRLLFIDLFDMTHPFLKSQSNARREIYEADGHIVMVAEPSEIKWGEI